MARKDPEKDKEYRKAYSQTPQFKAWRRKWTKEWRARNPEKAKATYIRYLEKNRDKVRERHKKFINGYTKRLKLKIIEKYGGKCVCCGESNIFFLTIDHVNCDGKEHRKRYSGSTRGIYLSLLKENPEYEIQILCFNCNMARQFYGGDLKICPHRQPKEFSSQV